MLVQLHKVKPNLRDLFSPLILSQLLAKLILLPKSFSKFFLSSSPQEFYEFKLHILQTLLPEYALYFYAPCASANISSAWNAHSSPLPCKCSFNVFKLMKLSQAALNVPSFILVLLITLLLLNYEFFYLSHLLYCKLPWANAIY